MNKENNMFYIANSINNSCKLPKKKSKNAKIALTALET
jgi:hypothetical protein